MTRNKNKKVRKLRGVRTHGYGNCQGRRKAGRKGGHGLTTGWKKGKKSFYLKQESIGFPSEAYGKNRESPWIHGKKGFNRPEKVVRVEHVEAINIGSVNSKIDSWVEKGLAEKSGSTYTVDLEKVGFQKLLARGAVDKKMNIKVQRASMYAVEEIENAGGSVTVAIKNYKDQ